MIRKLLDIGKGYLKGLNWRGWLHITIIIVLCTALVKSCYQNHKSEERIEQLSKVKPVPSTGTTQQAELIAEKVSKEGKTAATFREAEPIIKMIEDNSKADSIAKLAEVEKSKVNALTVIKGSLEAENIELKRRLSAGDTSPSGKREARFVHTDPYLSIEGVQRSDSMFVLTRLVADASVNKIDFSKKKYWVFGKNEQLTTIYYNSPYIRVNGLETLKIKQKEPFFDVKVNIEGKYLHTDREVLIGPKIRLGLGRVGITGGYYVNPGGRLGQGFWYGADYSIY